MGAYRSGARRRGERPCAAPGRHLGRACASLRATPDARIVNVSSGVGSLTTNSDPAFPYRAIFGPVYPASKTALNALTVAMALELEPEGIKVNAVSPGYTKTNLNGYSGTATV
jgi:NAD(P)-dependent dehydrogenase (short-subunit alcohol dehydrogenase family)